MNLLESMIWIEDELYFFCADYVNNNPAAFVNAYFDFASINIYSPPSW